ELVERLAALLVETTRLELAAIVGEGRRDIAGAPLGIAPANILNQSGHARGGTLRPRAHGVAAAEFGVAPNAPPARKLPVTVDRMRRKVEAERLPLLRHTFARGPAGLQ